MQGRQRFLTLGGHRRSFALTLLTYFRLLRPPIREHYPSTLAVRFAQSAVVPERGFERVSSTRSAAFGAPVKFLTGASTRSPCVVEGDVAAD
jgi:hypothetical protein